MGERYPGYDVLNKRHTPSWNEQTRKVVDERLAIDPEHYTFCTEDEWLTLKAVCGRIVPQPTHGTAASREYIDWLYNCKKTYPTYHGVTINPCTNTAADGGTRYPYIDNLKTAVGTSGAPSTGTWKTIGPSSKECNPSSSITYSGNFNYYVKCNRGANGFVVNSGVTVTFASGNVVFDDNVTVSNGGTLNINTPGNATPLTSACTPPTVQTPCIGSSSSGAAIVYIRGDNTTQFSTSGTGAVNLNHVFVYGGTGSVAFSGNPPTWTAPTEGPFKGLAYWTDMPVRSTGVEPPLKSSMKSFR